MSKLWGPGQAIVELTRSQDRPLLEIVFPMGNDTFGSTFRNKILLQNFGRSPAYSPQIDSILLGNDRFDFDPLKTSQLPIQPKESREVWVHHSRKHKDSVVSVGNVVETLERKLIEIDNGSCDPTKIRIKYFDISGNLCQRILFIKIGGILTKRYIYTSTSAAK